MINDKDILYKIEKAIQQLRPYLETDGGDLKLVEVTDDYIAKVVFLGACSSCSMSLMTLKAGVEDSIMKAVPEIKAVVAISEALTVEID